MGGEWAEERFGNLVQCVSDKCQVKEVSVENYISTENMVPNFGGITLASRVPLAGSVTKFSVDDTLFSNIRTYFKKVWQAQFDGYCSNDVLVFRSANDEVLAQDYLHQICRWERFTELSVRTSKGAKMPRGDKSALADFKFLLPPINEQRAIAHILGTLDDKIELNRRRNQTLEAMARALFKDWFVDFGPVRAKMEGREPYLPADLWQLFPDRLDEEGKPEGWEQRRVKDIGQVICGKTPSTKKPEYYGDDVPFITIPEMHGKIFSTSIQRRLSLAGANSQENKMLPPGAICVSCIATLGLVTITTESSQTNQQINSVIPAESNEAFYWYWTLKNLGEEIKAGGSGGSVLGNLSTGRFSELQVNASTRALRVAYNSSVESMFAHILANERESTSLAQLRDTLLPKLISGELRITDAEKFLERLV